MWIWTSSVLLSTLVVIGLSSPHPDDALYKIPPVGTGQRSQYYVLHSDGTFKYGYDTGDGAFESTKSKMVGSQVGSFGYVDPDGRAIRLEYEAGEGGFVARGNHLPKPSPELARAMAAVVRSNAPFVDPLAGSGGDASYGFQFQSEDHSRNEQSSADGTVTGSYSYVDADGVTRSFTYRAGKGIGFVIEGDGLTQDVKTLTPAVRKSTFTRTQQQQVTQPRAPARPSAFTRTQQHQSAYQRAPARPYSGSFKPSSSSAFGGEQFDIVSLTRSETPGDASYSFSYDAGDHSRSETSDRDLNINGKFSFVADDGVERTVDYIAGTSKGFQAHGDHLPKAPQPLPSVRRTASVQQAAVRTSSQRHQSTYRQPSPQPLQQARPQVRQPPQPARPQVRQSSFSFGGTQTGTHVPTPSRVYEEANVRSVSSPSGSYSFSYDTQTHSREESGDDDNNVDGNFAFVADDGQRRQVTYKAGSETGFIAEGAHLPIGPEVPGAPSGQPTGRLVRVSSQRFIDPLADTDTDASYDFAFESDTYSRSETADEDGNVSGTYTVVEDDGTRVTYRFRAGKGIGFETEEISRTQGPRPAKPVPYSGPLAGDAQFTSGFGAGTQSAHVRSQLHSQHRGRPTGTTYPGGVSTHVGTRTASTRSRLSTGTATHVRPSTGTATHFRSSTGTASHVRPSTGTATHFRSSTGTSSATFSRPKTSVTSKKTSFTPSSFLKSAGAPSRAEDLFPGFTLSTYKASPDSHKFGYVLKFD